MKSGRSRPAPCAESARENHGETQNLDILAAVGGLFLAVTLIVSGVLLAWAHNFIGNEVHTQPAAQKIYFPPAGSAAIKAPEFAAMRQYEASEFTAGAQAETYADHFIANHLIKIGGGKTYAQVSAEALASPGNAKLAATAATLFQGQTLRGGREPARLGQAPRDGAQQPQRPGEFQVPGGHASRTSAAGMR